MDLADVLGLLRRRWFPLLLCLLAGVGGAEAITRRATPIYQADARVIIRSTDAQNPLEAVQGLQVSNTLLRTYAALGTSRTAAERVRNLLKLPESVGAVRSNLSATPESETLFITISARDPDRVRATSIAEAATTVFIDLVKTVEEGNPIVEARLVDRAVPRNQPISPRPQANRVFGIFLGLSVGIAAALAVDALDRSIKTPAQAAELLHAPLLGVVPFAKEVGTTPIVAADDPTSVAAEAFRTLRTAVRFVDPDKPLRSILVTSPSAGEGKTTTAANLAVVLAQAGERVILVDADLRRSRLVSTMGLVSELGLTSVIMHTVEPRDALQNWRDQLAVMAAGELPPNPSEILGSQTMAQLIEVLTSIADVVVFDAPPVLPVTDAVVLATQVDGVIIVSRHNSTQRGLAGEARRRLDGVGANVVGCVLNGVPMSASYYAEYYSTPEELEAQRRLPGLRRAANQR